MENKQEMFYLWLSRQSKFFPDHLDALRIPTGIVVVTPFQRIVTSRQDTVVKSPSVFLQILVRKFESPVNAQASHCSTIQKIYQKILAKTLSLGSASNTYAANFKSDNRSLGPRGEI